MNDQLIESIAEATDVPLSTFGRLRLKSDNFVHRVRQGLLRCWDRMPVQARVGWLDRIIDANRCSSGAVLSHDPPVFLVAIAGARPLWMVESLSSFLAERRVLFLLLIYWSLENPTSFGFVRRNAERLRARFPKHDIVFLCNSREEERVLDAAGLEAIAANHNQIVSEHTFRPLANPAPSFDAVYNAKIARFKRHHLAAAIDRVLHVAYRCPNDMSRTAGRAHVRRILARSPNHRFANKVVNGLPSWLTPDEVNQAYNRASVGLCLSAVEGAMYSSMEYMLAGLPIVTTPNRGGRDVFFHPDYCLTAAPDPREIRDAVIALRDKAIPRDIVRQRTIERVDAARRQSLILLDQVLARHGTGLEASAIWPPAGRATAIRSKSARSHMADYFAFKPDRTVDASAAS